MKPFQDYIEKTKVFVKISKYRKEFTKLEEETFLTDLLAAECFKGKSQLYEFLKNGDIEGFKSHVKTMINEGKKLKRMKINEGEKK